MLEVGQSSIVGLSSFKQHELVFDRLAVTLESTKECACAVAMGLDVLSLSLGVDELCDSDEDVDRLADREEAGSQVEYLASAVQESTILDLEVCQSHSPAAVTLSNVVHSSTVCLCSIKNYW